MTEPGPDETGGGVVSITGGTGPWPEPDPEPLSQSNERFGTNFNPEDLVFYDAIAAKLTKRPVVQQAYDGCRRPRQHELNRRGIIGGPRPWERGGDHGERRNAGEVDDASAHPEARSARRRTRWGRSRGTGWDRQRRGRSVTAAPVVVVGAGPVGLSLALGLARHGVRSVVLERAAATSGRSKAPAIHTRTLEVLRRWDADTRLRHAGHLLTEVRVHPARGGRRPLLALDLGELGVEADRPGVLVLEQAETERFLLQAVEASGLCDVRFRHEVVDLAQDPETVTLRVRTPHGEVVLDADHVVGCDGAGSTVRSLLGLPFDGHTYPLSPMLADVAIDDRRDDLPWPRATDRRGSLSFAVRLRPGTWRLVCLERSDDDPDAEVGRAEVARRVDELLGPGPFEVVWSSRFRIHRRSSPRFRKGRVLLAGDAAHVHSPVGGQGMNAGIHDAHNLAWKLAAAIAGGDRDRLLDSYDSERRGVVVETVSASTDLVTRAVLQSPSSLRTLAFAALRVAVRLPALRRRLLRRATMLDLDLDPATSALLDVHDLAAGVRLPNPIVVSSADGSSSRLHDLLPLGPAIIEVADHRPAATDLPLGDVLRLGPGGHHDPTGSIRRLLGGRDGWILIRPDAHVAWARPDRPGMGAAVDASLGRRPLAPAPGRPPAPGGS